MATQKVDPVVYLDQYDITPQFRAANFELTVDPLDETVFGKTTRSFKPGLVDFNFDMEGFFVSGENPDLIDKILSDRLASGQDALLTASPLDAADGELAFLLEGFVSNYNPFNASVADLAAITFQFRNREDVAGAVRGNILVPKASPLTASGSGTARQLGAVTSAQRIWAGLHVFAVAGSSPTLDLTIESDDDSGFATPTTQLTFSQKTAAGFEGMISAAGPITDDWWRAEYTIGGTGGPSFTAALVVGIK